MTTLEQKQKELIIHLGKLLRSYNYEIIEGNSKWLKLESEIAELEKQAEPITDSDIEAWAREYDRRAFCGHFAGDEPSNHFIAGAKAMRDNKIKHIK